MKKKLISFLLTFFIFGCSYIPKIEKNELISVPSITSNPTTNVQQLKKDWWKNCNDPTLNQLITLILKSNSDLKISQYNIEKSIEAITLAASQGGVSIDGVGDIQRQHSSKFGTVPPPFNGKFFNSGSLNLKGTYNLDIFNKIVSLKEEAKYRSQAAILSKDLITLNISIETAKLYQYWKYLQFEKVNLEDQYSIMTSLVDLISLKYKIGNGIQEDVLTAENNLRDINNLIQQNKINQKIVLNSLIELSGNKYIDEISNILKKSENIQNLNIEIPDTISSDIIIHRPDVAYYLTLINAQDEHLKSAKAGFYPHFSISGEYGFDAVGLDKVLHKSSLAGLIGASIYLPIFNMGAVRSTYKIAGIDLNIAIEQYNKTVLSSFTNINNELYKVNSLRNIIKENDTNFKNDTTTFNNNLKKYQIGNISKFQYLSAKLQWLNSQLNNEQQHFNYTTEKINFISSIGGITIGGNNGR